MTQNGTHPPRLEVEMILNVSNSVTNRGYAVAAKTEVESGDDRKATALNLLEEILSAQMSPEMREVEGWPL